jgi:hypothetical protein
MALTTLTGQVDDNTILANERVIDMSDVIPMLDPDVSQFTTMLMQSSSSSCFSSKVEWLEDQLFPRLSSVLSGGATEGAAITVNTGEGAYFRAGDIVRDAVTGVCVRVISVAGDVLTVSNHLGRVAFAAYTAGDQLLILGNAAAQGDSLGTMKVLRRVNQYNYTQIFRNPYGFTRTLMASKLYGGPEPDKERKKKATEHKRGIEYGLFWGARNLDTSGAHPVGVMGGLFEFVTTNVKAAGGVLTKANLDLYMKDILQHGTTNHVMFASPVVGMALSGFLRDAWQPITVDTRLWGAKVDGFISGAYGFRIPVSIKRDWNDFSTANSQYGGWAFVVDMDNVELRNLRDTALLRDRQMNDADAYEEEYLSECSCMVQIDQTHGIITGITG